MAKFSCARLARARAARPGGGEGQLGQIDHCGRPADQPIDCSAMACSGAPFSRKWRACATEGNALNNNAQQYQFITFATATPSVTYPSPHIRIALRLGSPAQHLHLGFPGERNSLTLAHCFLGGKIIPSSVS